MENSAEVNIIAKLKGSTPKVEITFRAGEIVTIIREKIFQILFDNEIFGEEHEADRIPPLIENHQWTINWHVNEYYIDLKNIKAGENPGQYDLLANLYRIIEEVLEELDPLVGHVVYSEDITEIKIWQDQNTEAKTLSGDKLDSFFKKHLFNADLLRQALDLPT